jgi:hypothetical protein
MLFVVLFSVIFAEYSTLWHIILSVIMLNVVMLSVVAPRKDAPTSRSTFVKFENFHFAPKKKEYF